MIFWAAEAAGLLAASAALYGRYRVLPSWLTGPEICKLEDGGCRALFRAPQAALLGVPNSALALVYYPALAAGRLAGWPAPLLLAAATLALAMSVRLAHFLVTNRYECRVCWVGHASNAALWILLVAER